MPERINLSEFDAITFHFDGNNNDPDDIAGLPIAAVLAKSAGLEEKITFFYNNNLSEPDAPAQVQSMQDSAAFAEMVGIQTHDYQDGVQKTTDKLVEILDSGKKVLAIEGGPMEAIYRALEQTNSKNRSNVVILNHSGWNGSRSEGIRPGGGKPRTIGNIRDDFPEVERIRILDQNTGFQSSEWDWLDFTNNPVLQEARQKMQNARNEKKKKMNDPSDAGMLFYAITGNEKGDPIDVKVFLEANPPTFSTSPPPPQPEPDPTPGPQPDPTPETALDDAIIIEAEDMTLFGEYQVEANDVASGKKVISLRGGETEGTGTASINFNGPTGKYDIEIIHFDEADGIGKIELEQGNQKIASFNLDKQLGSRAANEKTLTATKVKGIVVKPGQRFTIRGLESGTARNAEHIRIDKIAFNPVINSISPDPITPSTGGETKPTSTSGSRGDDVIQGTVKDDTLHGRGGNDSIDAQIGNDKLYGGRGNDSLLGGAGKDLLQGNSASQSSPGKNEIDILAGGQDADRFVLGNQSTSFYNDDISNTAGKNDYAIIADFSVSEGDRIQLSSINEYSLGENGPSGRELYIKQTDSVNELIAVINGQNVENLELNSAAFEFV